MKVQELIEYLQTLPGDTKVTCCEDMAGDYYAEPTEVPVEKYHLDYTSSTTGLQSTNTLKIGMF